MRYIGYLSLFATFLCAACAVEDPSAVINGPTELLPSEQVSIRRDSRGVPHISARTDEGTVFGLGYVHAIDRLFQMETRRRRTNGTLSAVFGAAYLTKDKEARIFDLAGRSRSVYQQLDQQTQRLLDAYAAGVNRGIAELLRQGGLPDPFAQFDIHAIDRWTAADAIAVWTGRSFTVSAGSEIDNQQEFAQDVSQLGLEAAREQWLNVTLDDDGATIGSGPTLTYSGQGVGNHHHLPDYYASQMWAISGLRSTSGYPVLFGHPQLRPQKRDFYEADLKGATFQVHGIGFAGTPGIIIGYTPDTAWSVTSMGADVRDMFGLELLGDGYLLDGEETAFEQRQETIEVLGGHPRTITVRKSYFGPVINELLSSEHQANALASRTAYAMSNLLTTDYPGIHPIASVFGMMRAKNWSEFEQALEGYAFPRVHFIFIDNSGPHGTLAYKPGTLLPKRSDLAPLEGLIVQPGTVRAAAWQGFIQPPTLVNPPEGYIINANNAAVGSWYPHYGLASVGDTRRSWYLRQVFETLLAHPNAKLTAAQVDAIHLHCVDPLPVALVDLIERLAADIDLSEHLSGGALEAWALLSAWDGSLRIDSPMHPIGLNAAGYSAYQNTPALANTYGTRPQGLIRMYKDLYLDPAGFLTANSAALLAFVNRALEDALEGVRTNYGSTDPEQWVPDDLAVFLYNVNNIFSTSVNSAHDIVGRYTCRAKNSTWAQGGNAYSQLVDLGGTAKALSVPGVSQVPTSRFFANQMPFWNTGTLQPAPVGGRPSMVTEVVLERPLR